LGTVGTELEERVGAVVEVAAVDDVSVGTVAGDSDRILQVALLLSPFRYAPMVLEERPLSTVRKGYL